MVAAQGLVTAIRAAAPRVAKIVGPELARWLSKTKNREALVETLKRTSSRRPAERVRARTETTILLLEGIKETSNEPERVQTAEQAIARARRLLVKLDLPLGTREERRANIKAVASSLARLQEDLQVQLDDPEDSDVPGGPE